ncbi:hypothetical protein X739_00450 [Mesorhizobium sp. LNHC220B00]|nr:hypothetical protein [Mesorhizobium sp. LNHC220B00]ESY89014.1 hypothetical protein X739_00450 [Mesorhizobium sp. LNHC220B00]
MTKYMAACTTLGPIYPGYVNVSRDEDGSVVITVRGDPDVRVNSAYICGHAVDRGKPGRCTPGDEACNNYCNLAPEKGPMVDHPASCSQTYEGKTAAVRLSAEEWVRLFSDLLA